MIIDEFEGHEILDLPITSSTGLFANMVFEKLKQRLEIATLYMRLKGAGAPSHKDNPFVYLVELQTFNDPTLLEQSDGSYQIAIKGSPEDAGAILIGAKLAALEQKSLPPSVPTLFSRPLILVTYESLYHQSKVTGNPMIRQMVLLRPPQFPRAPFDSLSPVTLSDMMLNKVHQGKYLVCRAISQAVRLVAVQVAVEDEDGKVAELACYNCFETSGLDSDDIFSIIPVNQVMLIKEPWFKSGTTGGRPTVRIDTPSDIIFLPANDPMIRSYPDTRSRDHNMDALAYKAIGNEAVKKKQMLAAVRAYTSGLAVDPTASLLRLNRAFCHLQLGNISLALNDARWASEDQTLPDDARCKARFRMALAYYAMDRFTDALRILEGGVARWSPTDFEALRRKARARLVEQTQGSYDWLALSKLAKQYNGRQQISDVADYVGPVKVVRMDELGGGRGLVTTRPVMAGELLIVSKPFAFAAPFEFPEQLRALHAEKNLSSERPYYELMGRIARRLMGDHTAASALLLDLYPGDSYQAPSPDKSAPSTPTFLTHGGDHWTLSDEYAIGDIDMNKVAGIVATNSFSEGYADCSGRAEAVYLLPSLINHACFGTAVRTQVGSIMTMRASRDLQAGEEITCSYTSGMGSYLDRGASLNRWMGRCNCELCSADRLDGKSRCQNREEYLRQLMQDRSVRATGNSESDRILRLVLKIRSTYLDGRTAPMGTLGLAQYALAIANHMDNPRQAVQFYIDALRSHGIGVKRSPPTRVPLNHSQLRRDALIIETNRFPSEHQCIIQCIEIMVGICTIEYSQNKDALAAHWAVAALWTHEAFFGPGKKHLWHTLGIERDQRASHLLGYLDKFE